MHLLIKLVLCDLIWRKLFKIMHHCIQKLVCSFQVISKLQIQICRQSFYHSSFLLLYVVGREDKLNADNRLVVNNFQVELSQQIGLLCNLVETSLSEQKEHLMRVEKLSHSLTGIHEKVFNDACG